MPFVSYPTTTYHCTKHVTDSDFAGGNRILPGRTAGGGAAATDPGGWHPLEHPAWSTRWAEYTAHMSVTELELRPEGCGLPESGYFGSDSKRLLLKLLTAAALACHENGLTSVRPKTKQWPSSVTFTVGSQGK